MDAFIEPQRTECVYILSRGALESYLPAGHGAKDLNKLISLLAQDDFWEQLPLDGKAELELIAKSLLPDYERANENEPVESNEMIK